MNTAYIALGSNMGDRLGNLSEALDAIADLPSTHVTEVSHAYESEPAYETDQRAFLNAVIEVETGLEPEVLMTGLLGVEDALGRERVQPNGPRVIDVDLLLCGDAVMTTPLLTLPHPRLLERDFVVTPLVEIAGHLKLPTGERIARSRTTVGRVLRDYGHIPDPGMSHGMPVEETEWVAVAQSEGPQTALGGFDAALQFERQALEDEGIPSAYEPFEPGMDVDFLGRPRVFSLVVPAEYARRALEVIADVQGSEPSALADDFDESGEWAPAVAEDEDW